MVLLAWGASRDDYWIPLILVMFLLMVLLGQRLARYIFQRFFNRNENIEPELPTDTENS